MEVVLEMVALDTALLLVKTRTQVLGTMTWSPRMISVPPYWPCCSLVLVREAWDDAKGTEDQLHVMVAKSQKGLTRTLSHLATLLTSR